MQRSRCTELQANQKAVLQNLRMQINRRCCTACWVDGHLRRNWSCPKCVDEYWKERDQRRSDRAGSAATDTPFDALKLEVVELKAKVVELEAEVERLRGEVHGHYAHARERDQEILDRALQMVRRESRRSAVPHDTRDAVDIAVPEGGEETSHDG